MQFSDIENGICCILLESFVVSQRTLGEGIILFFPLYIDCLEKLETVKVILILLYLQATQKEVRDSSVPESSADYMCVVCVCAYVLLP